MKPRDETTDSLVTAPKVNILIVDDLPDKVMVVESMLDELGQNLVSVYSGSDALREVLKRDFAVILLDVNMPDIDGFETAALIRRYRKSAHTPIIFITAYADDVQTARGYSLGAVDYIFSPVVPDVLRSKVRVFVELFQMHQRSRELAEERIALAQAEIARRVAEEKTRRSSFLSRASQALSASLDSSASMHGLVDLLVPELVPFAAVLIGGSAGEEKLLLRTIGANGGAQTACIPACVCDESADPLVKLINDALAGRAATDRSVELSTADLQPCVAPSGQLPVGLDTGFVLPLWVGERHFGALMLAAGPRSLDDLHDRALLEEVASRAAIALENAHLYNSLQMEIAERRQAEERLREADRRKDEFLAMLAHELRNPLAPIRSALEVIHRLAPRDTGFALARNIIERQVVHMTRLVDDLLDVGRIGRGIVELRLEPVELTAVIQRAVELTKPLIDDRRHRLELKVPDQPIWLLGDFARLSQVLANILNNAAKFSPEGGRIELKLSRTGNEATLSIRDNGVGMEAELLARVFDLFAQGDRSLDRSQGGLGIGLTVVRRLVELHRGAVQARSAGVGRGSEFLITLPCGNASRPNAAESTETMAVSPLKRILVVDDNDDAAESLADFLTLEGHCVRTASDGRTALTEVMMFMPDVVLLDIGLPGMSGYEIAHELRSRSEAQGIVLIALTGYGQEEDRNRSLESGFDRHLVKPIDPNQLAGIVATTRRSL